jgi:DNA-binding MarR family transcriptional regulator
VRVRLTGQGRRLLQAKREVVLAKQQEIYESLTSTERKQAEAIMRRLAVAMEDL